MRIETLLIICRNKKVLLGLKSPGKKFGGMWNGWGGGVNRGESLEQGVLRELAEETAGRIQAVNPQRVGYIHFQFETAEPDHHVHIFTATDYQGQLTSTRDFTEYREFPIDQLPEKMMPADKKWIPYLATGRFFRGDILIDKAFKNPIVNIEFVERL